MSGTENTDGNEEQTCDMCKISYVTEKELKDHEWSLMHHIKVEQRKKGSIHKCSLCFTTCPNLIDYGKHLNGDKHKQAIEDGRVQRETLDPQLIQSRLQSGEKEVEQEELQDPVRVEPSYNRETKPHQRSYSQPQFRGQYYENRQPFRNRQSQFYEYEEGVNYNNSLENPHWHRGGMRQMFPYRWGPPWEQTSPDPWEHPHQIQEDMDFQFQEKNIKQNYRPTGNEYSDRGRPERFEFLRPERDLSEQEPDKRRMESDRNKKSVRFEDDSEETSGYSSQPNLNQELISTKRRKKNTDVMEVEQTASGRTTKNSKTRPYDPPVVEADSTTDLEISMRKTPTEIERKSDIKKKPNTKLKKKKSAGSKNSPRSDEGDSVLERAEKLCKELRDKREKAKKEFNSKEKEKKIEKNKEINQQLAKLAEINKSYVRGVLDDSDLVESPTKTKAIKISSGTTANAKILEICCSPVKSKENSSSAKTRTNKTGSPGRSNNKSSSPGRSSKTKTSPVKLVIDSANIDIHSIDDPDVHSVSGPNQSKGGKRKEKQNKPEHKHRDINDIRREIELEVQQSQLEFSQSLEQNRKQMMMDEEKSRESIVEKVIRQESVMDEEEKSAENDTLLENKGITSTLDDSMADSSKLRSSFDSASRESLLKMVNSPRSRKERQQLAEVLRTYAKSQNRLSLPRFNLHMSGLYDNLEHYGDFRLEELSPDVQLQIAELIEADIKPDLEELEKTLLCDIKAERTEDVSYPETSSRLLLSTNVDKLELLDNSLNQNEKSDFFDIDKMSSLNKLRLSSCDIKKEPTDETKSPVKSNFPQSPQYSQEEREFIEKFCAPGSPGMNNRFESPKQVSKGLVSMTDIQIDCIHSPQKQTEDLRTPFITENQEKASVYDSPIISQMNQSENKSSPKVYSDFSFRSRSSSLSSLETIGKNNLGDSLRPETKGKKTGLMDSVLSSIQSESQSKINAIETIPEKLQSTMDSQRNPNILTINRDLGPDRSDNRKTSQFSDVQIISPHKPKSEPVSLTGSSENSQFSIVSPVSIENRMFPYRNSPNESFYSSGTVETAPPVVTSAAVFNSGLFQYRTPLSEVACSTGTSEKFLSNTCNPTTSVVGSAHTKPFYDPGSVALTSSTTATTWSSSSGYSTQPKVLSSSDMSLSNASTSRDVRMRRPSETSVAESLVDTVYDISIKEEDIRQELHDVDEHITRLQRLIEESTVELNKFKDRKIELKQQAENLRSKRINVLQEARDKQRRPDSRHDSDVSDRPTPPLSASEDGGISSGGRIIPFSEGLLVSPGIRHRTEHQFSNPSFPNDESGINHAVRSRPSPSHTSEDHPEPMRDNSAMFDPYILRGMQTLYTIQHRHDHNRKDTPSQRQTSTEVVSQMMPPPTMSPMRMGQEIRVPSPQTMSPQSLGSVSPVQRIGLTKDKIRISDILYEGASFPPVITSSSTVSSANFVQKEAPNELEKSLFTSTLSIKSSQPGNSYQQQSVSNTLPDRNVSQKIIARDMSDNDNMDGSPEDVIMMSDDQKPTGVIVIHDSPKRSNENMHSHTSRSQASNWVAAEKPDSESQSKHVWTDESQLRLREKQMLDLMERQKEKTEQNITGKLLSPVQSTGTKDGKKTDVEQLANAAVIKQYGREPVDAKDNKDNNKTDLKSFGFITLSHLMNSNQTNSPQTTPVNSPRKEDLRNVEQKPDLKAFQKEDIKSYVKNEELQKTLGKEEKEVLLLNEKSQFLAKKEDNVSLPKSQDFVPSLQSDDDIRLSGSDKEKSHVMKQICDNRDRVNVQYMGSIPQGIDKLQLLKQFKAGKDDRMSFLVVDGDQHKDMYDKLQLLLTKPPSGVSHQSKDEVRIDVDDICDSGIKDTDSNFESLNSNSSLGEKIRHYCNQTKPDNEETLIMLSDEEQKVKVQSVKEIQPAEQLEERRSSSPYRKRLKTKKERDRASIRKQKEGCILESSSDYNSADDDTLPKYGHKVKGGQKSKHSDVEIISDMEEDVKSCDKISTDLKSHDNTDVMTHRLLEEVQLETESDDSRLQLKDKFSERFKLKPDFIASLKAAVKSSLSKDELKTEIPDNKVKCCGPTEQVSGIQVIGQHVYVSYIGVSIRKFHIKTGELVHTFSCSPYLVSCLYVLKTDESLKLYTGGSSQHLLCFNAITGQQLRSENLEEKLQCFHHNWGKLFIGTYTGSILVWSTKTDRNIDAYVCSDRPISCISSATEGAQKVILVAAYDSTVFVLSATSGLLIRILEGHTKTVFSLQVDGSIVFSGSGDKTVIEHNLQTGDMVWTYTQATGIVTAVSVYEDLLFSASFDKFIRCYTREDHKLIALYYGADRGLVTQMTVTDDKIITGNRNGIVEVVPINRNKGALCQFEGCSYVFGVKHHLLYHLMSDHVTPNTKMFRCLWKGCKDWLSTKEGPEEAENHMTSHVFIE